MRFSEWLEKSDGLPPTRKQMREFKREWKALSAEWEQDRALAKVRDETGKEPPKPPPIPCPDQDNEPTKKVRQKKVKVRNCDIPF